MTGRLFPRQFLPRGTTSIIIFDPAVCLRPHDPDITLWITEPPRKTPSNIWGRKFQRARGNYGNSAAWKSFLRRNKGNAAAAEREIEGTSRHIGTINLLFD